MRSNLAVVQNDNFEDDHMFSVHATQIRAALNRMQHDTDFHKTFRAFDRIVSLFATLATGNCSLNPPESGWGRVVWVHLTAMADIKSHAESLEEARRIREQFTVWPKVLGA